MKPKTHISYNKQTKQEGELLNGYKDRKLLWLWSKSTKHYYIRADSCIALKC